MNCKNESCQVELIEFTDDGEFFEVRANCEPRYAGYCEECYSDLRSGDLETQLEELCSTPV